MAAWEARHKKNGAIPEVGRSKKGSGAEGKHRGPDLRSGATHIQGIETIPGREENSALRKGRESGRNKGRRLVVVYRIVKGRKVGKGKPPQRAYVNNRGEKRGVQGSNLFEQNVENGERFRG